MATEIRADSVDGSANPTGEAKPSETGKYEQNIDGSANPIGEADVAGATDHAADWVPEQPQGKAIRLGETATPVKQSETAQTSKRTASKSTARKRTPAKAKSTAKRASSKAAKKA